MRTDGGASGAAKDFYAVKKYIYLVRKNSLRREVTSERTMEMARMSETRVIMNLLVSFTLNFTS